ncbi:uncharacterized protein A1O5_03553 [Cladophialophora psammophila CBS 110553]|uniref:Uncharacterized protein n=1 Tax=Cladophialophora psammophila CBS 110553 TaxID=1182543 RepID=W9XA31_9EURO|nr:uncharacterized protein A1O5_03553 [Cladophialophora psammophila CBS 110553]EXJ73791.1 hypothetical protein A1O5_03553 [Cladophialophora psammophila CBS 110553]
MSDLESSIITSTLGNVIQTRQTVRHLQQTMDVGLINIRVLMMQVATFNTKLEITAYNRGERRDVDSREDQLMDDFGSRKFRTLEHILRSISTGPEFPVAKRLLKMEQSYVKGTCIWIKQNDEFRKFLKQSTGLLFVKGNKRTGMSMMLFYVLRYLLHEYQPGNEFAEKIDCCVLQLRLR